MADRYVKRTKKDKDGDILALCNSGESWSPRSKQDAINDIEKKLHRYFVVWSSTTKTEIRVVDDRVKGKYLRTDKDQTSRNNLDDLPDC